MAKNTSREVYQKFRVYRAENARNKLYYYREYKFWLYKYVYTEHGRLLIYIAREGDINYMHPRA